MASQDNTLSQMNRQMKKNKKKNLKNKLKSKALGKENVELKKEVSQL